MSFYRCNNSSGGGQSIQLLVSENTTTSLDIKSILSSKNINIDISSLTTDNFLYTLSTGKDYTKNFTARGEQSGGAEKGADSSNSLTIKFSYDASTGILTNSAYGSAYVYIFTTYGATRGGWGASTQYPMSIYLVL